MWASPSGDQIKMKNILRSSVAAIGFIIVVSSAAFANNGVFDHLDPCIAARDQFSEQRATTFKALDQQVTDADKASATPQYRTLWIDSKKQALRPLFDSEVKPVLQSMGVTDFDIAYAKWFNIQIAQLTPEQLQEVQDKNFRLELKSFWVGRRINTATEIDKQHAELSKSCKMDVGNQALRVAMIGALKPITVTIDNWKSAEGKGFIAQVIKTGTGGIDPVDIVKCPIRGCSDKSVVNQVLHMKLPNLPKPPKLF